MGGKLKIKQWKITETKGTKFSDTNKSQLGGKWPEKEGNLHTCSGINSRKVCDSNIHKEQPNIAILMLINNKTALSYLLKIGGKYNRGL